MTLTYQVESKFEPFLRSTPPNWTHFCILRVNLTRLNPKNLAQNWVEWFEFDRTNPNSCQYPLINYIVFGCIMNCPTDFYGGRLKKFSRVGKKLLLAIVLSSSKIHVGFLKKQALAHNQLITFFFNWAIYKKKWRLVMESGFSRRVFFLSCIKFIRWFHEFSVTINFSINWVCVFVLSFVLLM